jgi:hypothetical protein
MLNKEVMINEQVINVMLAPLSSEFTLKTILNKRDERLMEVK